MIKNLKELNRHLDEIPYVILAITFWTTLINAFIQGYIISSSGWTASTISTTILTGVITFLFYLFSVYLFSYGKRDLQIINPKVILYTLFSFFIIKYTSTYFNYGIYLLIKYLNTGILDRIDFYAWLGVFAGIPLAILTTYNASIFYRLLRNRKNIIIPFRLRSNTSLPVYITEFEFITKNKKSIPLPYDPENDGFNKYKKAEPVENINDMYYSFNKAFYYYNIAIPNDTDSMLIAWYSLVEKKYYRDTFPLKPDRFDVEDKYYIENKHILQNLFPALTPKKTKSIDLRFKIHGNVDLYTYKKGQKFKQFYYLKVNTETLPEEKLKEISHQYFKDCYPPVDPQEIYNEHYTNQINKELLELDKAESSLFNWKLNIEWETAHIKSIWIDDLCYNHFGYSAKPLTTHSKKYLPVIIEIYAGLENETSREIVVTLDGMALFNQLKTFTGDQEIDFKIRVMDSESGNLTIEVSTPGSTTAFKSFTSNVINYDK